MKQTIKKPVISEKSFTAAKLHKFCFWADKSADKEEIAKAISDMYKVDVISVNTQNIAGKIKRSRGKLGKRDDLKKVTVTLKAGQKIALFEAETEVEDKKAVKKERTEKKKIEKTDKTDKIKTTKDK